MSRNVIILGAGASRDAGAPLMNDFLDVAENLWKAVGLGSDEKDFARVFEGIRALDAVHARASIQADNLEDIFSVFEMGKLLHGFGPFGRAAATRLPIALRTVIVRTLNESILFPKHENTDTCMAPPPYDDFVGELWKRHEKQRSSSWDTSFITFNYDLCLDYALWSHKTRVDYCLIPPALSPARLRLLKLHGSLNWYRGKRNNIEPWYLEDFFNKVGPLTTTNPEGRRLDMSAELGRFEDIAGARPTVVIVPPTWDKTSHHRQLGAVWQTAAAELRTAENIFVCGYSLPDTDYFFRSLYALGTLAGERIKRFWVYDPSPDCEGRFQSLLGPTVRNRRFRFHKMRFSEAWKEILDTITASGGL